MRSLKKNRLVNPVGEGEGETNRESSIETYTLPYVKQIASASSMYDARHPKPGLCDNLKGCRGGGDSGWRDTCMPMSDSC